MLHMRQGLVHKNIVHIKGVFGKLQTAPDKQPCPVNNRVHQYILPCHEKLHVIPSEYLVLWKCRVIFHHFFPSGPFLLIDKVGNQHVQGLSPVYKAPQGIKNLYICLLIDPVVAVHHLKENACGIFKSCVHRFPMPAVFLVDGTADSGIFPGIPVSNFSCPVFGGSVIHNDDFHFLPACKQGVDTVLHIAFRVVAGDCHSQ